MNDVKNNNTNENVDMSDPDTMGFNNMDDLDVSEMKPFKHNSNRLEVWAGDYEGESILPFDQWMGYMERNGRAIANVCFDTRDRMVKMERLVGEIHAMLVQMKTAD